MRGNPAAFFLVPDHFKTEKNVYLDPWQLKDVPDHFKTQEMCDDAVWGYPFSLQFVPYWFVTQQQIDAWCDDDYWYDDDEIIGWYNGYQKRKAQKAKIKEEILPITFGVLKCKAYFGTNRVSLFFFKILYCIFYSSYDIFIRQCFRSN